MGDVTIRWQNVETVKRNTIEYGKTVKDAVVELLQYWERVIESYAKVHAPWVDRTGNARQNLFSYTDDVGNAVRLYLSHRMDYGLWLEVRWSGRYAIILPTLQAHERQIMASVKKLFK